MHVVMARPGQAPGGAGGAWRGLGGRGSRKEINMKAAAAPPRRQRAECCTSSGPRGGVGCRTLRGVGWLGGWGEGKVYGGAELSSDMAAV